MPDRLFFAAVFAAAAVVIALAVVWPQGYGLRSPGPFGGPVRITDASRRDLAKEQAKKTPPPPSPSAAAGLRK